MSVIDPSMAAKLAKFFCRAIYETVTPDEGMPGIVLTLVPFMASGIEPDLTAEEARPYVQSFLNDVRSGKINPFVEPLSEPRLIAVDEQHHFQTDLFGELPDPEPPERALIDQLISATRLYTSGPAIQDLLDFTTRLREYAPFNAMLLHIQKPGLTHAASAYDWWKRFQRVPKEGARPLLVLRAMGPVDFAFDILDTEGADLPVDAFAFPTLGNLSDSQFDDIMQLVKKDGIDLVPLDAGDGQAGWIRLLVRSKKDKSKNIYQLAYNRNHPGPTRFVTVAHELAHMFLGHLGADFARRVPDRRDTTLPVKEVEAEIAAYLVAKRNGLAPRSETYLAAYQGAFSELNLYAVMRAANAIETTMGISSSRLWDAKGKER